MSTTDRRDTQDPRPPRPAPRSGPPAPPSSRRPLPAGARRLGLLAIIGAAVGSVGLIGASLFAIRVLRNSYYVQWSVVSLAGIFALLAWILYLRDDLILARNETAPGTRAARIVLIAAAAVLVIFSFFL